MNLKPWLVYGVIGAMGLAATYLLATPGPYEVSIGILRFDPYYVAMTGFAFLMIIAIGEMIGITIPEKYHHPKMRE